MARWRHGECAPVVWEHNGPKPKQHVHEQKEWKKMALIFISMIGKSVFTIFEHHDIH